MLLTRHDTAKDFEISSAMRFRNPDDFTAVLTKFFAEGGLALKPNQSRNLWLASANGSCDVSLAQPRLYSRANGIHQHLS